MSLSPAADPGIGAPQRDQMVSGRRLLLALALIVVLGAGAGGITWGVVRFLDPGWTATVDFVVLIVAEVYASVLGGLFLAFGGRKGLRDRLGLRFTSWRDLLQALGLDVVALLAGILGYVLLTPVFGSPLVIAIPVLKSGTDVTRLPGADPLALALIFGRVFLLVPLAEELFFRGALYGWLRRRLPALPTILLTAIVFGFEHTFPGLPLPQPFFLVPLAFIYGIAVGWVRERTGSTLNTAVMHVVVDAFLLIVASLLIPR